MATEEKMQSRIDELEEENARLKAAHTELHRRTQAAESAMADLLRCSEKLASGAAWCGGNLGRAFLAYDCAKQKARILELEAALRPFAEEARRRSWITNLSAASGLDGHNIGGSGLTNGDLRRAAELLDKPAAPEAPE